jgi:putative transport protein
MANIAANLLTLFQNSPLLTLFMIVGVGYLLGKINLLGFRLGVAGVLFIGLAAGALMPKLGLPDIIGTLGLVLFVYSMGLQSGKGFVESFCKRGVSLAVLTLVATSCGFAMAMGVAHLLHLNGAQGAGLFTGAATNTPALAVVLELAHSSLPGETYGIAYPFGVIGVLLCFHIARLVFRPKIEAKEKGVSIESRSCRLTRAEYDGMRIGELHQQFAGRKFRISRVRHGEETLVAASDTVLHLQDILVVVGSRKTLPEVLRLLGEETASNAASDDTSIDYRRIIVSNPEVASTRIEDLEFPCACAITRVRRGDSDFLPTPQTRLDYGDRIRVVAQKEDIPLVSRFFGDSIRGMAEMDYLTIGLGLFFGVILGMIPIPIPGFGEFKLGYAGGPLLVALVLGYIERTGPLVWTMPVSANLTLRQVGLVLFLAVVGVHSGPGFVHTLRQSGPAMLLGGMAITLSVTLPALLIGYKLMRIPFDELLGVVSGIHTESAAVGFASNMVRTDRPERGYSNVYALALILKVIFAQVIFRIMGM